MYGEASVDAPEAPQSMYCAAQQSRHPVCTHLPALAFAVPDRRCDMHTCPRYMLRSTQPSLLAAIHTPQANPPPPRCVTLLCAPHPAPRRPVASASPARPPAEDGRVGPRSKALRCLSATVSLAALTVAVSCGCRAALRILIPTSLVDTARFANPPCAAQTPCRAPRFAAMHHLSSTFPANQANRVRAMHAFAPAPCACVAPLGRPVGFVARSRGGCGEGAVRDGGWREGDPAGSLVARSCFRNERGLRWGPLKPNLAGTL